MINKLHISSKPTGFQGFDVKPRDKIDLLEKFMLIFLVHKKFTGNGRVVKVRFYQRVLDEGFKTFYMIILQTMFDARPSPNHYKPVKYASCTVQRIGINECVIDIKFNKDEVIGIFFPENSGIPYSNSICPDNKDDSNNVRISKYSIENFKQSLSQPVEFTKRDCRKYSLQFTYDFD